MVWLLIALAIVVALLWADHSTKKHLGDGLPATPGGAVLPQEPGIAQDPSA